MISSRKCNVETGKAFLQIKEATGSGKTNWMGRVYGFIPDPMFSPFCRASKSIVFSINHD